MKYYKHVKMTFRFEDEGQDITKRFYEVSDEYLKGVANNYKKIYENRGKFIGVLIEYDEANGFRNMEWIA